MTLVVIIASFFVALGFALRRKQWFMGWFLGSVLPAVVFPIVEFFSPSGWLMIALAFGTLYSMGASAAGLLMAWVINTGKAKEAGSER